MECPLINIYNENSFTNQTNPNKAVKTIFFVKMYLLLLYAAGITIPYSFPVSTFTDKNIKEL